MRGLLYFLLFLLVVFGVLYALTGWSYSDGERAGTVSKFSRRGFIFKTYEGVLNVGGFSGETGSLTPQYFDFSVKDEDVAKQITDAVKTGQRVTLHYEEKILKFPWNGETKYYITGVEIVGPPMRPYGDTSAYPGYQPGQTQPQPGQPQAATQAPATSDSIR
ncbi:MULTISPECIES: hypothetical protein [unclassified Spirosoma]|uniref:hypothetical protein n=1 Tax=unclassified Spirosoma TaxID=2621999 RepID=UPI000964B579|nr:MULTISPECIES: hypothetical protein [unclassified Spirosoma]MBN8823006.1 hypothetical protein [Spirosoma sp.]OJW73108.1 MAG: hypothetical protein BGO59_06335 [Spirosoma sp. 48-14]